MAIFRTTTLALMAAAVMAFATTTGSAFVVTPLAVRARGVSSSSTAVSRGTEYRSELSQTRTKMSLATPPPASISAMSSEVETRRSAIREITSHDDFLHLLAENQDKVVVIKFYDQFCRACDEIAPRYEELSLAQGASSIFSQVEFTACKDVCKQLGIRRLPTVQIYTEEGRVADLPAGPSRFSHVEEKFAQILGQQTQKS